MISFPASFHFAPKDGLQHLPVSGDVVRIFDAPVIGFHATGFDRVLVLQYGFESVFYVREFRIHHLHRALLHRVQVSHGLPRESSCSRHVVFPSLPQVGERRFSRLTIVDQVVFKQYSPDEVEVDGVEYLVIDENDILAIVK